MRLREIVGDAEAERRFKKRWAIIQVWRPIRGKVMIDPLGICDGRSIPQKGFILVERRYQYRTGEVYHIAHDPAHEWFYFPQMERNEALVFKVFDSDTGKPSRFTAHSAFDDPATPAGRAAAREHRDPDLRVLGLADVMYMFRKRGFVFQRNRNPAYDRMLDARSRSDASGSLSLQTGPGHHVPMTRALSSAVRFHAGSAAAFRYHCRAASRLAGCATHSFMRPR